MKTMVLFLLLYTAAGAQELTLDEALQKAFEHQPALQRAQGKILESQGTLELADTLGQPTLGLQTSYTFNDPPLRLLVGTTPVDAVVSNNWASTLSFRQVIATFGRLHWAHEEAELQKKAREAELQYTRSRLREEVKVSFYQLLHSQALIQVREDALKARQAQLDIARKLVGHGAAPGYDARRDQAGVAQAQQDLSDGLRDETIARARLTRLLGEPVARLHTDLEPLEPPPAKASGENRPDLAAVRWALAASQAHLELMQVQDAPTLSFQSDYGRRNALGLQPGQLWSTGLVLNIPLFDGGVAEAKSQQAQGALQQLQADVEQTERDIALEVETGQANLQSSWRNLDTSRSALGAAEEAARIARLRYQNGFSTNLELLDAEAALTQAQQNQLSARYHYLQARAHWERIVSP
ncbi:hypothetical protein ABS71_15990 [bacterium SCN 62-11]|nr:TolC family protein [Candidatus Eremiobacteraeota bacterium]ODT62249.1 MAG: hypothetical protein ABS71_15990 [bacterium SCN 62-11]